LSVRLRSALSVQDTPNPILEWKVERLGTQCGDYERALILSSVNEHGAQQSTWERISMQSLPMLSSTVIREYYHTVLAPDDQEDVNGAGALAVAERALQEAPQATVLATLAPGAVAMPLPPTRATVGAWADALPMAPPRPVVVNAVPLAMSPTRAQALLPARGPASPEAYFGMEAGHGDEMVDSVPDAVAVTRVALNFADETLVDSDHDSDGEGKPRRHPTMHLVFAEEELHDSGDDG
jgi:hypothetical protein